MVFMLRPAQLYFREINASLMHRWYDLDFQYYAGTFGMDNNNFPDDNRNEHSFASVDKEDKLIGHIAYTIDRYTNSTNNWRIINFKRGNMIFMDDLKTALIDVFTKYNFARVEWYCVADNPAIRGYRNFIKRFGGRECGYFRNETLLLDGKLHDSVFFELLAEEFFAHYKQ